MKAGFDKWWLLPFSILAASALVALSIIVFGPSFIGRLPAEVAQRAASGPAADCSGASVNDYACYQKRYQRLVRDSGVETAFAELKDEYAKNNFVRSSCHQLTHVIGRTAADLYGDISSTYGRGDEFCGAGYYHGAIEAIAAKIGPDRIVDEADTICADLREGQKYSYYHRNCVHGLGHGFMGIQENELFGSLQACDALKDGWEQENCYGGVFMQNVMALNDPSHPSKYLKADQPLYPCTDVQTRYKDQCYKRQTLYALHTQGYDFAKVFNLCATAVEEVYRPACYQGVGWDAAGLSINREGITQVAKTKSTSQLCTLGKDYEARSNCVVGAVKDFVIAYHSDAQTRALCESFNDADLHAVCLKTAEEYNKNFQP